MSSSKPGNFVTTIATDCGVCRKGYQKDFDVHPTKSQVLKQFRADGWAVSATSSRCPEHKGKKIGNAGK